MFLQRIHNITNSRIIIYKSQYSQSVDKQNKIQYIFVFCIFNEHKKAYALTIDKSSKIKILPIIRDCCAKMQPSLQLTQRYIMV